MSTTQDHGDFVFQCDALIVVDRLRGQRVCGETLETGTSNFEAARNVLRRAGWKPFQVNGEWLHRCAACRRSAPRAAS